MIPFRITFRPGVSISEQVVYAAKKAVVSGTLQPGDVFPSVRALGREFKINPNTAHKVVGRLVAEGVLEVLPGRGTVVSRQADPNPNDRGNLLVTELEQLVVEAKKLGLRLDEVHEAIDGHWHRLDGANRAARRKE